MRTRKYDPLIEGTQYSKVEYLRQLDEFHRNEAYLSIELATNPIRRLAADGILTDRQIASVFRCRVEEVRRVLDGAPVSGRVRGAFDPLCIQTLIRINELQRDKKEIAQATLIYVGRMITPSLFTVFTGIDRQSLHRVIHR